MKKHKSMLLLLGIFLLLVVLYLTMSQVNKKQTENEETIWVTNLSDVVSLEYTDGEDTMSFVKEEDVWYVKDNKELKLDSELVQEIADELSQVAAVRKLKGADEPEAYGLDEPLYTITMKDAKGEVVTLYIGDGAGENYYATVNEKEEIYTVSSNVASVLEFDNSVFETEEEATE